MGLPMHARAHAWHRCRDPGLRRHHRAVHGTALPCLAAGHFRAVHHHAALHLPRLHLASRWYLASRRRLGAWRLQRLWDWSLGLRRRRGRRWGGLGRSLRQLSWRALCRMVSIFRRQRNAPEWRADDGEASMRPEWSTETWFSPPVFLEVRSR